MAKRFKESEKKEEKEAKKKAARKKNIEKKKKQKKLKEQEKQKADIRKKVKKQEKREEKEKAKIKRDLEKQQKKEEEQKLKKAKANEKLKREREKQKKAENKRKQEEREKRIQQRKMQKEDDDFEYEANTAIKMTMKNNKRKKEQEEYIKQRAAQRKKRRIITGVVLLVIFCCVVAFALISPIFNIQNIEVLDNNQISKERVESISGLQEGNNIFRFLKINVINSIKKEPCVEDVEVKRVLPGTVQIKIKEREKKFYIKFMNGYASISSQGYILAMVDNIGGNVPVIQGIETDESEITPGNRLNERDLRKLETVLKIINTFKDCNMDNLISDIDIESETDYNVIMKSEQKTIHLGDKTDLNNKIIYAQAIIEENKGVPGEVFVNGDFNNKFRAYFRQQV